MLFLRVNPSRTLFHFCLFCGLRRCVRERECWSHVTVIDEKRTLQMLKWQRIVDLGSSLRTRVMLVSSSQSQYLATFRDFRGASSRKFSVSQDIQDAKHPWLELTQAPSSFLLEERILTFLSGSYSSCVWIEISTSHWRLGEQQMQLLEIWQTWQPIGDISPKNITRKD